MPDLSNYESLKNITLAHEVAVVVAEERERLLAAAAGQRLLGQIVKPCLGSKAPKFFNSSMSISHIKKKTYKVEGNFPLEPTVVGDRATTARLVLTGTYVTLANRRQKGHMQEDPLRSLVPQNADLTLVLADLERPYVVTPQHWAAFDNDLVDGLATGFYDPMTEEPLRYDDNYYEGIVSTLTEAVKIQTDACGV